MADNLNTYIWVYGRMYVYTYIKNKKLKSSNHSGHVFSLHTNACMVGWLVWFKNGGVFGRVKEFLKQFINKQHKIVKKKNEKKTTPTMKKRKLSLEL